MVPPAASPFLTAWGSVCVCACVCVCVWWGGDCSHPSPMEGKLNVMRAAGWGGWGSSWGQPSRCTPGPLDRTNRSGLSVGSHPGSVNCTGVREGHVPRPAPHPLSESGVSLANSPAAPKAARPRGRFYQLCLRALQRRAACCNCASRVTGPRHLNLGRKQVLEGGRSKVWASGSVQPIREAWQVQEQ